MIGLAAGAPPARSLTSAVLAQLRAEILSCRLPPGERLLIAGLARRFGVSLSAVREALARLAAEGLVQAEDQRGFRVSPVSTEDLRDITWLRIEIEGLALRRSIALGDAGWEAGLRAAWQELAAAPVPPPGQAGPEFERWRALHHRFHLALVAGCRSPWLLRFRSALDEQAERYRFLAHTRRARDVAGEHRAIAEAALARDAEAAVGALADHLALTARIILDGIQEDPQ